MKNTKIYGGIAIVGGILTIILILSQLDKEKRDLLAFVSVIGTMASLVGLVLAYLQIISLKESSNQIRTEVEKTIHRVDNIVSVSDISKTRVLIGDIQIYLRHKNFEGALIRMKDLKDELVSAKYIDGLTQIHEDDDYKKIVLNTGIDINTISNFLVKPDRQIDIPIILSNLEKTRHLLVDCYNKIRKQGYGID